MAGGTVFFICMVKLRSSVAGLLALVLLFLCGWFNVLIKNESLRTDHLIRLSKTYRLYQAIITTPAEEKESSWKHTAQVTHVYQGKKWTPISGKVLMYFSKRSFNTTFCYGDRLIISGMPQEISLPMNPGEFNYRRFLSFQNIYHQHFIGSANKVIHLENHIPNPVLKLSYRLREKAREVLNQHLPDNHQRAVAFALLLGVRDALDNDLNQAYAAAGAMHVLAVSGLHVGILYGLLLVLLRPLAGSPRGKWIIATISIIVLWAYAVFTGLSPSVLRAVTMFSFVAMARPLQYRTNIYNILAASAFILLVFNPFLIMSVGFQLSYLAVLGIVYLHPLLYHNWDAPGWLGDKVWQITSVSIAAQVGTFVPGLLYFHQFPTYFLISNLLVIPLSTLVLINGLMLFFFHNVAFLDHWLGLMLKGLIDALNFVVIATEKMPFALIEPVYISTAQSWLLAGMTIGLLMLFLKKTPTRVAATLITAAAFAVLQWHRFISLSGTASFIVYHTPGHRAIEFVENGKSYGYFDSALLNDEQQIKYHIRPNRIQSGVRHAVASDIEKVAQHHSWFIIRYKSLTILYVLNSSTDLPEGVFDYLILGHGTQSGLNIPQHLSCKKIITDGTLNGKALYSIKQLAARQNRNLHITSLQGAFKINI